MKSKEVFFDGHLPYLIDGFNFLDDRGTLKNINLPSHFIPKRYYIVDNHSKGFVRAFHGHKKESKMITCVSGAVRVIIAPMSRDGSINLEKKEVYHLGDGNAKTLYIPSGWFNGWQSLVDGAKILIVSSSSVEDSKNDDYRVDANIEPSLWKESFR